MYTLVILLQILVRDMAFQPRQVLKSSWNKSGGSKTSPTCELHSLAAAISWRVECTLILGAWPDGWRLFFDVQHLHFIFCLWYYAKRDSIFGDKYIVCKDNSVIVLVLSGGGCLILIYLYNVMPLRRPMLCCPIDTSAVSFLTSK